ncbi:MAG: undecaprenyldiphospho-muramoylpentapeptide beta-N-acetylglucosaminyltransferase [Candidatus Binatia bacterium]
MAIAGGGTGGHLFPGLAVAEYALATGVAGEVVFFGAERGIESRLVPAAGYELFAQPLVGIAGGGPLGALRGLARLARAILSARSELRRRRIDVMIGLGGYASSSGVIAARLAGVPVVLLEQNRDPGLSNRTLARLAAAVCTSFEETAQRLPRAKAHFTGNPVRPGLEARAEDGSTVRDTLLVFGGSAGAVTINRAVVAALGELAAAGDTVPSVLHQTGKRGLEESEEAYARLRAEHPGLEIDTREFIDDMGAAYRRARLAVCRAGATSVAELVGTETPSILVPYPHAAGDHQTANARALERAGAAVLVVDGPDLVVDLTKALARLLRDPGELDSMARRAAELGRPGAAARVMDIVAEVLATKLEDAK